MTDPIDNQELSDFQVSKYRLTGAFVWLGLLVIIVPIWYSNPVNFDPAAQNETSASEPKTLLIEKPFLLPGNDDETSRVEVNAPAASQKVADSVESEEKSQTAPPQSASEATQGEAPATQTEQKASEADAGKSEWIIRLVAYRKKEMAEVLQERLKYDYEAFIKYFPKSNYYSVRVGPYTSKKLAEKDQKRLDRLLRIQSQLVKFKRTP